MKSILPLILLLLSGISSTAGNLSVTFDLSGNPGSEDINITLRPAEDYNPASSVTLARSGTQRTGEIPASPSGLYYLYCYTPQYQTSIPVSLDASSFTAPVKVNVDAGDFVVSTSLVGPVNSALADANSRFVSRSRLIGNKSVEMTGDELRGNLRGFSADADAVISAAKLPAPAQEFIRLWAYTLASDSYSMALYMRSRADKQVTFSVSDILPPPAAILDTPMAAGFPSAMGAVVSTLPGKSLEERLESLHSGYRTQAIKDNVTPMLIESFLSSFDYKNDFESGEARLAALTDRYSLPAKYLAGFRARRATVPGLPFPSGITLLDRDGNTVDFSSFRGKYVYVDLWASWCGPCCKEVPFLQKLEKELSDSNVIFVSISCDSSTAPWLKKMQQLSMHGNQLIDTTGDLNRKLNIRGIPHFLIYDPQGNLHTYNAPRPSSSQILPLLRSLK